MDIRDFSFTKDDLEFIDDDFSIKAADILDEAEFWSVTNENQGQDQYQNPILSATESIIPGHLNSAITNSDPEFILELKKPLCQRHKMLVEIRDKLKITKTVLDLPINYHDYYKEWILRNYRRDDSHDYTLFKKLITLSVKSTYLHIKIMTQNVSGCEELYQRYEEEEKRVRLGLLDAWPEVKKDFQMMKRVEEIKDKICYTSLPHGHFIELPEMRIDRDVVINELKNHPPNFGSTTMFLCFLDKLQAIFSLKLYWLTCDLRDKYSTSLYSDGKRIYDKLVRLRSQMGNGYYKFLSTWEALMVGYAIKDEQDDVGFTRLYDDCFSKMEKLLEADQVKDFDILDLLPPERNDYNIIKYIELTGMAKIFGHPTIDPATILDPLRTYGTTQPSYDQVIIDKSLGVAKRDFIINYQAKHHKLPNIREAPDEIKNYLDKNSPKLRSVYLDHIAWSKVEFEQTLEYDYTIDSTELIKDSAAAAPMSEYTTTYDKCAYFHRYNKLPPPVHRKSPTRVITAFLQGSPEDLVKKFSEVCNMTWDKEDRTAVICPKEGEMNPVGRGFLKQTPRQRLLQTSMEHNVANFFRYVPEQTMTDSEIIESRKISADVSGLGSQWELINLDLEKWNLKFRHILVTKFGRMLDQLFGIKNAYEYNHIFFLKAVVLTNSRLHPPDFDDNGEPIPGPFSYTGHLGGFEGMRQKLWTWITMSIMKYTADQMDLRVRIMGQGDNQVIIIKYREEQKEAKTEIRNQFLNLLSGNFNSVNLKLKLEETWISQRLHEYGKNRHFKGIAISQGTKKCVKFIPDINDNIKSLMSSLSTINTTTESIAKMDTDPDCAFILNQFHVLNYLERSKILKITDPDISWLSMLYHPADFGGICLSTYFSHFVRGYDDKVNLWLYIFLGLKKLKEKALLDKIGSINQFRSFRPGPINYGRLIEDPYSLNITSLPSIEMKFKELSYEFLKNPKFVKNESVRKLFTVSKTKQQEELVKTLTTMKPLYLTLAFELVRNSNYGIAKTLQNKFTSIQSISKVIQNTIQLNYLEMMLINNERVVAILRRRVISTIKRGDLHSLLNESSCSTELAKKLRFTNWKIVMINDTKPLPLCQFNLIPIIGLSGNEYEQMDGITLMISEEYTKSSLAPNYCSGPWSPYLGNVTREKITKPKLDLITKSDYLKSIQNLFLMHTWLKRLGSDQLSEFTLDLIYEKAHMIPELLDHENFEEWCPTNYGGNMIHRFQSIIDSVSALTNMLPTLPSHLKYDTNKLRRLTAGGVDLTIHFQLCLVTFSAFFGRIKKSKMYQGHRSFIFKINDCQCTQDVTELKFDIDPYVPKHTFNISATASQDQSYRFDTIPISIDDNMILLSRYLGELLGKNIEQCFHNNYLSHSLISKDNLSKPTLLSVNDLSFANITHLILGLITSSHHIRNYLHDLNNFHLAFTTDISLANLCQAYYDAGTLNDLCQILGVSLKSHYEAIQFEKLSPILLSGLIRTIVENIDHFITEFCRYSYIGLSIDCVRMVLSVLVKVKSYSGQDRLLKPLRRLIFLHSSPTSLFQSIKFKYENLTNVTELESTIDASLTYWRKRPIADRMSSKEASLNIDNGLSQANKRKLVLRNRSCRYNISLSDKIVVSDDLLFNFSMYNDYYLLLSKPSKIQNEVEINLKNIHHISRIFGNISSAFTKIYEILLTLGIIDVEVRHICSLAEGSGGILCCLGEIFTTAKLTYNTLISTDIDLRQTVDQNYPPAMLNSSKCVQERISSGNKELVIGETDITTPTFIKKFKSFAGLNPITLFTMDAESTDEGDNLNFLSIYLPILVTYRIPLGIFKVFILDGLSLINIITEVSKYPSLSFCIMKPISTNPNNFECYLIVANQKSRLNLNNTFKLVHNKIQKMYINSTDQLKTFLLTSHRAKHLENLSSYIYMSLKLKATFLHLKNDYKKQILLIDKYSHLIESEDICNLYCFRFLFYHIQTLVNLHCMEFGDKRLYPMIRMSNLNDTMYQLMKNITFMISVLDSYNDFEGLLKLMENTNLPMKLDDLRKRNFCLEESFFLPGSPGSFTENWNDSKLFFKHLDFNFLCGCELTGFPFDVKQERLYSAVLGLFQDSSLFKVSTKTKLRNKFDDFKYENAVKSS